MSRIDDALRRARGQQQDDTEATDESAWAFANEQPAAPVDSAEADGVGRMLDSPSSVPSPAAPPALAAEAEDSDGDALRDTLAGNEKLVGGGLPASTVEEYRTLAASLHQAQMERGLKVLLVASAVPGEGKTLTAANVALTLSLSYGRRTLLIDADLRKPSLHNLFRLPTTSGLSEGLAASDAVRVSAVQLSPLLAVLPAGRPVADPVPLLTSDRMRQLIDDARQYFDWVVVDTPPVGLLTDANLLAAASDASLLVVNAGRTQYGLVEKAIEALGRPKIFGVVMNRVEQAEGLTGSDYTRYYSDYLPSER